MAIITSLFNISWSKSLGVFDISIKEYPCQIASCKNYFHLKLSSTVRLTSSCSSGEQFSYRMCHASFAPRQIFLAHYNRAPYINPRTENFSSVAFSRFSVLSGNFKAILPAVCILFLCYDWDHKNCFFYRVICSHLKQTQLVEMRLQYYLTVKFYTCKL